MGKGSVYMCDDLPLLSVGTMQAVFVSYSSRVRKSSLKTLTAALLV